MNTNNVAGATDQADPSNGIELISVEEAKNLLQHYLTTADSPDTPVKGVFLDRNHLDAMNTIKAETPALTGFMVLFGKVETGATVGIVVGVDNKNQDEAVKKIYKTQSVGTGPCPPFCDMDSPIFTD